MREVSPKELRKLNDKSFKNTQRIFRRRLREIAADGDYEAKYKPSDYCCGDRIADWLRSLGFVVKEINPIWSAITWPEGEDILKRLHSEQSKFLTRHTPAKFTWGVKIEREELGVWTKDPIRCDYVCSACGKYSEYTTDFCCNCGKKMKNDKERQM